MDDAGFTTLLLELAESSGTWKALAIGGLVLVWRWWRSIQTHLCQAIPDALAIGRKVAEDGLDVRLRVHMCDENEQEDSQ